MHQTHLRTDIQRVLNNFTKGELTENATHLLKALGYQSQRTLSRDTNTIEAFHEDFDPDNLINPEKAHLHFSILMRNGFRNGRLSRNF